MIKNLDWILINTIVNSFNYSEDVPVKSRGHPERDAPCDALRTLTLDGHTGQATTF